jgi:AP-2 complex subunit mu-1
MASSILLLNSRGEVLIYRSYRDDVSRSEVSQFCTQVVAAKEASERPIVTLNNIHYIHISQNTITLVAASASNVNVSMIIQFLYKLVDLFKAYFGGEFNEASIRKNYVLIYELLDEIVDFGLPQMTEPEVLKQFITTGGIKKDVKDEQIIGALIQATGVTSWRAEGIKYKRNEVYIDVIENVNVLLSSKGTVLRSDVSGQIMVKSQLSFMPECKFGMNDKLAMANESQSMDKGIAIDDIKFHQCVRLGKFDKDRAITFIPPDGIFELMTYRVTENINLPFKIMPIVQEYGNTKIEISLKIKSMFDRNLFATNIVIKIPVPRNTGKCNIFVVSGKAKYEPEQSAIMWRIRRFGGDSEFSMRGSVNLVPTSSDKPWSKPPISIDFQVPMFTASGLRVRFLRVIEKSNYKPIKWIRYITKAGTYQHRI